MGGCGGVLYKILFPFDNYQRRRRNAIDFLKLGNGMSSSNPEEIKEEFINNFQHLFTSSLPSFPSDLEGLVPPMISEEDNEVYALSRMKMKFAKLFSILVQPRTLAPMVWLPFSIKVSGTLSKVILFFLLEVFSWGVFFLKK